MHRPRPCRAVIFDLDGVLTDTAHLHFLAWRALAESVGLPFDETFNERLKGVDRMGSLALILAQGSRSYSSTERAMLAARKNAHYQRLLSSLGPGDLLPGAAEALTSCRAAGLRIGLASVSHNAPIVLDRLGLASRFDHVVDARKVQRSKPDPEIFLTAAAALGVPPAECVGVEDAQAGIEAIKAAGMYAIGVGPAHALPRADEVIADLRGLRLTGSGIANCPAPRIQPSNLRTEIMLQQSPIYVYFPARDLARARQFYEGKLGLVPQQELNGGVVYQFSGGTAAFLYPTPNAGTSKASQAFWSVADVDREIAELKRRGVVFEHYDDMPGERSPSGAITAGGAKAAWFKDSEGNILALIQTLE